jgi:hypothetical protein
MHLHATRIDSFPGPLASLRGPFGRLPTRLLGGAADAFSHARAGAAKRLAGVLRNTAHAISGRGVPARQH